MATSSIATLIPASKKVEDDDELVKALDALSLKNKRLVKSSVHTAPADPNIKIRSWKMDEFKYNVHPSPFPTLARGLFTREIKLDESGQVVLGANEAKTAGEVVEQGDEEGKNSKHLIVVRGYDKFFNMGEVPWNTVSFVMM